MDVDQVTELGDDVEEGTMDEDEYYEEYDEELQTDVERLHYDDEGEDPDADESHFSIRVDRVYSEAGLNDELEFDVEEVEEEEYNDESDTEQLYEEQDQFDEGNLQIVEEKEGQVEPLQPGKAKTTIITSSYLSAEFSDKLKTLRDTIEYDRVVRSGSSSLENSRGSGSNETMQSALRYLQQLAKDQCMQQKSPINEPDDQSKEERCSPDLDNNAEPIANDEEGFKKPNSKSSSPKLVTAFSDQIRKFKNEELARQQQLQQESDEDSSKEKKLPSYVQEMIEKDESLKRLLKTGSVTISQIHESSPPSSPSSTSSSQQSTTTARSITCTPVNPQTKQAGKGTLPGSVIPPSPSTADNILSSNTVFKTDTDWSQFPTAHKLIEIAALVAENAKQDEIKLSVGKHFSALPGANGGGNSRRSLIPGRTDTTLKQTPGFTPALFGTSSKLFNHIKAPEPKPSTSSLSSFVSGLSLIGSASKSASIPSSATSYLQQLANANKLKNQASESLFSTTKSALQNGGGSILNTKLPLKRIISEMLDKEIDDQVPTSSKNFRTRDAILEDGPPDEFDPMRFLEVSLQEDAEGDEYEDEELDVYQEYESEMLQPKATGTKQRELTDDEARRKYICPHCLKGFCWSTDLKRHILTHTGERPFGCPHCSANFTRKFLMQKHVKKYHGPGFSTENSTSSQIVRTSPNSLLKSSQPVRRFTPQHTNGKLSNHKNSSGAKVLNGSRIVLNGNRNGFIEHKTSLGKPSSPSSNQQYYKYDPMQNINHILKSTVPSPGSRRSSTSSPNQIFIKQKHMQPQYDDQGEEYEDDDEIYTEEDLHTEYGLSTGSNNSSNDAEEDVNFPTKPKNPIVINISSRNGTSTSAGARDAGNKYNNLKIEPRRINQSLVKQLIRANAQIKITASTGAGTPSSSSSRSLQNGNGTSNNNVTGKDDTNVMPPPSFTPSSSTIPRLKR